MDPAASPVMTSTFAGQTTINYVPYVGDRAPIFDGTTWTMMQVVPGLGNNYISVGLTDTTRNPSPIGANKVNDWFVWDGGNPNSLYLSHGPDWTSDTVRSAGTALTKVNGIRLNSVAITNGPAAQRGTYVGTTRSNASSTLDWIFGAVAAGGTAGWFGVWNAYNRVDVTSRSGDTADSWTVGTGWASNAAGTRHSFVSGLAEDAFDFRYAAFILNGAGFGTAGIGFDVTNTFSGTTGYVGPNIAASSIAFYSSTVLGFHFGAAIEVAANQTSATVFGDANFPTALQSGIWFSGKM